MSTQVLVWLGAVTVALIVTAVLWALVWAVAWSVAWVWNWWSYRSERRSPNPDYDGDGWDYPDDGPDDDDADGLPPLPPERTWEQMTSHQLPVVGMSPAERKHWQRLERARKRRAGRAEITYRAHYAALGFEFPSGLMARVRELTP